MCVTKFEECGNFNLCCFCNVVLSALLKFVNEKCKYNLEKTTILLTADAVIIDEDAVSAG